MRTCLLAGLACCLLVVSPRARTDDIEVYIDEFTVDGGPLARVAGTVSPLASSTTHEVACRGGARSSNPDADITVFIEVWVDGRREALNQATGYAPTVRAVAMVPGADYDRRVQCILMAGSVSANAEGTLIAVETPYTSVLSDTLNQPAPPGIRRDLWYQVWHFDGRAWSRGGEVWEEWWLDNPCGLPFEKARLPGQLDPWSRFPDYYYTRITNHCQIEGRQYYRLPEGSYQVIRDQGWRFNRTGIWDF